MTETRPSSLPGRAETYTPLHPRAWAAYLAAGATAIVVYYLLPYHVQPWLYGAVGLSSASAIVVGIRRHRPEPAIAWWFLFAGQALFFVADVIWARLDYAFPTIADALYLLGYPCLGVGLALMLRRETQTVGPRTWIDAAIVTAAVGTAVWMFAIDPYEQEVFRSPAAAIGVAYPLEALGILAILARIIFAPGRRSPAYRILVASISSITIADLGFAVATAQDGYSPTTFIAAGWLAGYVLLGASALHPSMRGAPGSDLRGGGVLTWSRFVLLAAAVMVPVSAFAVARSTGMAVDEAETVIGSGVLFVLVTVRMGSLIRDAESHAGRLRESEARLSEAQQMAHVGNWEWDVARDEHVWSEEAYRLFGLPPGTEVTFERFLDRIHPEDRQLVRKANEAALRGERPYDLDYRVALPDGSERVLHARAEVTFDEDGRPLRMVGTVQDVTERKQAEAALQEERERALMYLDVAGVMMIALNAEGEITLINRKGCELLGYREEELLGRNWFDLCLTSERRDEVKRVFRSLMEGEDVPFEYFENEVLRRDGEERVIAFHNAVLRDRSSRIVGTLSSGEDVTERKRAEAELHRTIEDLRRVDDQRRRLLADVVSAGERERARIADDIHDDPIQVMTAVGMQIACLARIADEHERIEAARRLEETVSAAIARLRDLTFELRPRVLDRGGLSAALRVCLDHLHEQSGIGTRLDNRLSVEPPTETRVILYRTAQEALTNVRKHARATEVNVTLVPQDGGFLVRIEDDGVGFDQASVHATGDDHAGLVAMRERAETAGGWFRIESSPGAGTRVGFWVPAEA